MHFFSLHTCGPWVALTCPRPKYTYFGPQNNPTLGLNTPQLGNPPPKTTHTPNQPVFWIPHPQNRTLGYLANPPFVDEVYREEDTNCGFHGDSWNHALMDKNKTILLSRIHSDTESSTNLLSGIQIDEQKENLLFPPSQLSKAMLQS